MERFLSHLSQYRLFLGSRSPRRESLLKQLGIPFTVWLKEEFSEDFDQGVEGDCLAKELACRKASLYLKELQTKDILITADTLVILDNHILTKPKDREDSFATLSMLSGREHSVITGVCLTSGLKQHVFSVLTHVAFDELSQEDIDYYIDHYEPYDKAGSYGIQEWIGFAGVKGIKGSYFNVMGLPIQRLFHELKLFTHFI